MTLSSNFALKRGGGRNNEGGVTTREYGISELERPPHRKEGRNEGGTRKLHLQHAEEKALSIVCVDPPAVCGIDGHTAHTTHPQLTTETSN